MKRKNNNYFFPKDQEIMKDSYLKKERCFNCKGEINVTKNSDDTWTKS
jgi:hypothetical protein